MRAVKFIAAALILMLLSATAGLAQDSRWPRIRTDQGNTLIIYQPQVDDWKDFKEVDWRMAFSLTPKGGKQAIGVAEMHGRTTVNNDAKMVLIDNIKVERVHFPSLDGAAAAKMEQLFKKFLPQTITISLQQFVACVPKSGSVQGVKLKNDPPRIFVSYKPAILLGVNGPPVRGKMKDGKLEFVINTHWPLFFDPQSSMYYLLAGEQWLMSASLEGPWSAAKKLPKDMGALVKEPGWKSLKKYVPPPPAKPNYVVPAVFYSTDPAEIILFTGKPAYKQIPGTQLKHATNTRSYVFLYTPKNQYYYLTAGRWFSANSLEGPWTYATPSLPADFAKIPPSSPAGAVLASVPGTEEAKDAVLLAQVPITATVSAQAATGVKVTYAGTPQFIPIEGTSLYYAKNSPQTIIKAGDFYYLCFQGIWFVAAGPQGPWQIAKSVPEVIYTIPPGSPVYHVTYVTQTVTSDGDVQASYTSGYTGAYIEKSPATVVVVYGTGFYYPPYWYYDDHHHDYYYYPPPPTYGYYNYVNPVTGAYGVAQTVYGPYGSATRTASYNPYTGTYARTASVSTPYGSTAAGRAYNPYTGAAAATRQSSNAYASWGSSVVTKGGNTAYTKHYSNEKGTVGSVKTSSGGKAVGVSSGQGKTVVGKTGGGDMYASHDGNVYKNTGSGWQKYENGSWSSVDKPTPTSTKQQSRQSEAQQKGSSYGQSETNKEMQALKQEAQNRQRGELSSQRAQQYGGGSSRSMQGSGSGSRMAGGGGGSGGRVGGGGRGGGGRR